MSHITNKWTQIFGSSYEDSAQSVSTAADGSVYIVGTTYLYRDGQSNSHVSGSGYNTTSPDAFLSKYNSDGSKEWTQLIGITSLVQANSVSTAADGSVYIVGSTYGDIDGQRNSHISGSGYNTTSPDAFLSKYNSDGSKEWTQLLGTTVGDVANGVSTSSDGSVYIAGSTGGDLDGEINNGGTDAFLTKYNSEGFKEWTQLLGTPTSDYGFSVDTSEDGSVYITGTTYGDLDGQTNSDISDALTAIGDVFLTKYNSDGSKEWTNLLGSSNADFAEGVSTAADGSVYITGRTKGDLDGQTNSDTSSSYMSVYTDAFLSKYNSDGSKEWTQLIGTTDSDYASGVSTASDGSAYVVGSTYGDLDGQVDSEISGSGYYSNNGYFPKPTAFLVKYNSDGSKESTQLIGTNSRVSGKGVSTSPDGSIYIVGNTDKLNSNYSDDIYLSKFINEDNEPPTEIDVSANSFNENIASGSTVAILSALDPDAGDTHAYIFASGDGYFDNETGSTSGSSNFDNNLFAIEGDQLKIIDSPDFETKSSYLIRVQATDSAGHTLEKEVTLNVKDVNEAPYHLSLSTFAFDENLLDGSAVAIFSTLDPDHEVTYSYSFVTGDGDTDNSEFVIEGDQLKIIEAADFENKSSYSIRVQTKDSGGLAFEKSFVLNVNDLIEDDDIPSKPQTLWWTELLGSPFSDSATSVSIAADGSVYVGGNTRGGLDGQTNSDISGSGYSSSNAFLSKYNSDGSKKWTQLLGTTKFDIANGVSTAKDGSVYIVGSTEGNLDGQINSGVGDAFLSKFNSDGSKEWTQLLGTTEFDIANGVSTAADGSVYITGNTYGNLDGQTHSDGVAGGEYYTDRSDVFLSKYNSDGAKEWTQLLGTPHGDYAGGVSTAADGSVYVAGWTRGDLDGQINNGGTDAFLTKYNSDGSKEWTKLLGSYNDDYANDVSTAADGSVYIAGEASLDLHAQTNSYGIDAFLSKYNSDGIREWSQLIGTVYSDSANGVSTGSDGSVYVAGWIEGDLEGQTNSHVSGSGYNNPLLWTDAFLSKYNSDGSKEWTQLLGTTGGDTADAVSTSSDGSVYVAGWTTGDLDRQINNGGGDAFLSKFIANNSPIDINMSASSFDENIDSGFSVAMLSASDQDPGDKHSYALVSGDGDADNSAFIIEGDQLKIIDSPDFETKSSYSIRLETKDFGGLTFEKSFVLDVNDLEVNIAVQSDLSGRQGSLVSIPIQINDASGVEAIDLNIAYDQNIFDVPTSGIFEPGELNPGWSLVTNASVPGVVSLSSFGNAELGSEYGSIAVLNLQVKDYAEIGKSKIDIVDVEINENQITSTITDGEILVEKPSFQIRDVETYSHGLLLQLNDTPDMDVFRLYSGKNAGNQDPGLVLTNSSNEEVNLSAHWEDDTKQLHLLSNQILEDGGYTLRIRADGLVSQSGNLLDGNGDGVDGDDYEYSFSHVTPDHFISVGDTARSAGQDLSINGKDLKAGITGIPIHLSTTSSLQSVSGEISYDSDLLKGVSLAKGSDLPSDWVVNYSQSSPGTLAFTISGQTGATGSIEDTLRLMGQVDANASDSYGSTSLIQATITDSSAGQISFKSDPGLMVNAYSGDTTGNGSHSSLDASRVQRVVVGLDSGFDAFDDINPVLIGDTTGNGSLSSLDASRIQQEVVGLPVDTFPGIPEI